MASRVCWIHHHWSEAEGRVSGVLGLRVSILGLWRSW